ncbi:PEP-CTERM sorting domain-containing protein [Roseateles sp.]|uniref:PEP-CTERM sorting domain-containing protein n=1 Tax=Roseateles sp. TaxID=1971397 RepID=UPI003266A79D
MARRSLLIASLIALPMAVTAAGFDAGDEGWATPTGGTQTWQGSGGNGGGWLQIEDIDGNTDILLTAPSAWLGNWSAYLGGTLSFDAKKVNDVSNDWPGFGEIRISGPGGSVLLDVAEAGQPVGEGEWHRYSVALTPAAGWGPSLASVLANVTSLTINGEFHAGPGEVVGFDNIQVTAVPEPASAALLLAGIGLLACLRRKR